MSTTCRLCMRNLMLSTCAYSVVHSLATRTAVSLAHHNPTQAIFPIYFTLIFRSVGLEYTSSNHHVRPGWSGISLCCYVPQLHSMHTNSCSMTIGWEQLWQLENVGHSYRCLLLNAAASSFLMCWLVRRHAGMGVSRDVRGRRGRPTCSLDPPASRALPSLLMRVMK